jgi:general secretion pathway protein A
MHITPALFGSLEKIRFMVSERQGLAVVLGDNGMGKSTILRYLLSEYSADGYTTAIINHTEFPSPYAMLKEICIQFGIEPKRSQVAQHKALESWLVDQFMSDRTVVLFVDESQRLTAELLEVVRALLNFETYEDKLLQIIMAGTLELRDRILAKKNKALRSRVFSPCMITPMGPMETSEMIRFRCERAGLKGMFDDAACAQVYSLSGGVPRDVLIICSHAWNLAKTFRRPTVTAEIVHSAYREMSVQGGSAA